MRSARFLILSAALCAAFALGAARSSLAQTSPDAESESLGSVSGVADQIRGHIAKEEYSEALGIVRRELLQNPAPANAAKLRILEARILLQLGEDQGAAHVYRRLLDDPELGGQARAELHDMYVRRGRFDQADRLTEAVAVPLPGADPQLLRLRACSQTVQGRYAESARLLVEPALAGDSEAQLIRANALLILGDQDGAEALFLQVLRESSATRPRQVAHFGLGQIARLSGARATRALQDEKAVQLGPAPWAELDWGLALRALGRKEEARERLLIVTDSYPQMASTARLAIARLDEEEGKVDTGIENLVSSLDGTVTDFLALTRLGDLLIREGHDDDGIEVYRSALELFPAFPPVRDRLTRALASRGRWEEAPPETQGADWDLPGWTWDRLLDGDLPFLRVATDRDSIPPEDPRRIVLALVYLRGGFGAAALGWTEGVDPDRDRMLALIRAEALLTVGRRADAISLWRRMSGSDDASPIVLSRLAQAVYEDDPEEGRTLWRAYFQQAPSDARAWIRLAKQLEAGEEYEDALSAYARALDGGWLSPAERRRVRVAREDVEDMLRDRDENGIDEDLEAPGI